MDIVWIVLLTFGILVLLGLLVGGAFFLVMRLRTGAPLNIDVRALVRLYLYVGIVAGLLVFTQGTSELIKAGAAGIAGNEFSYRPVWVELPGDADAKPQHSLELADRRDLSSEELEELSRILAERQEETAQANEERDRIGLERAFDEGLIAGISFFIIGALVWGAHMFGRNRLETPGDRAGPLNRVYLVLLTVIFGIITIVSLPQAVFETLRYAVLDPVSDRYHPGEKLALSITALPIWLVYLWHSVRSVRRAD